MAQALLPLKDLVAAKTRLAGLLSASERRHLAQSMVEDVLATLVAHPAFTRITLVSDDPGAGMLAANYSVDYLPESALQCRGLNAVLQEACSRVLCDANGPCVVLHGDIPLLSTADLDAVLSAQEECGGLLVACDRHGQGTNLLAFAPQAVPQFGFGVDSCARHVQWARQQGVAHSVVQRPGTGLDIDELADLQQLMTLAPGVGANATLRMLTETGLAARLELALGADANPVQQGQTAG